MLRDIVKNKAGCALVLKNGEQVSYQQIDALSSRLAEQLLLDGVNKNTVLPVFVDNSLNTIVFAVACWKVGGIYTPLNQELPVDVLGSMLTRLNCNYVYYTNENMTAWAEFGLSSDGLVVEGVDIRSATLSESKGNKIFTRIASHKQLAVIIHTSGSTGVPKAACWSEGSVISFFDSYNDTMEYGPDAIGVNNGPFYFDIVFQDTFIVLYYGGKVIMHDRRFIPGRYIKLLNEHKVTHMAVMSSTLKTITRPDDEMPLSHIKKIMAGGEVGNLQMFEKYERAGVTIYNGYGPTENNSLSGRYRFDSKTTKDLIPIGTGFKNVAMVLLGDAGVIGPDQVGDPGQILLGGDQMMEGYIEHLQINRDVFTYIDGKQFYPTGDFGYYDDKGQLVFEGRRDRRVKINGNRFSLTTVYKALTSIDCVSYAVVNLSGTQEDPFIVAAITLVGDDIGQDEKQIFDSIRTALRSKLSNFMLPKYLFLLTSLPYKPSQKVDEKLIENTIEMVINTGESLNTTAFVKI